MALEFRLEEGDVLAFLEFCTRHRATSLAIRRRRNYGHAFLLVLFGLIFWFFGGNALAIAFLVLGPVWVAWWPARVREQIRKQAAAVYGEGPSPRFEGTQKLKLEDAGLVYAAPTAESRVPFTNIQRVVSTPEYVFIFVGALQALIVPRRHVSSGDVDIFVEQLRPRLGEHARIEIARP